MKQQKSNILITILRHWRLLLATLCMIILVGIGWRIYSKIQHGGIKLLEATHTEAIETTPEEIRAIRDIGEWEFLSIATEELIERHEARTFGDHHLVKVYRGVLRIGIDMKRADDDWFKADSTSTRTHRPTAILTLPPVELLDSNFIDEARTTTFYEKGRFGAKAKEEMRQQAAETMKRRTLTEDNIKLARKSADDQFTKLFNSLGYENVVIRYRDSKEHDSKQRTKH